jgi:hypothetical protein
MIKSEKLFNLLGGNVRKNEKKGDGNVRGEWDPSGVEQAL